jgi:hypothetical protein
MSIIIIECKYCLKHYYKIITNKIKCICAHIHNHYINKQINEQAQLETYYLIRKILYKNYPEYYPTDLTESYENIYPYKSYSIVKSLRSKL